jgi:hypothetical protein
MADASDGRGKSRAVTHKATTMQRYNARSSVILEEGGTTCVEPYIPLSNAINMLTRAMSEEATITDLPRINPPVSGDTTDATPPASEDNTVHITDATTITSSPFLKLPGEIRNRIYRFYFEDFDEQMSCRFAYNKSKMSPNFLALLHTNRMVRSEAGSIFYKEVAPFHSFTCPTDQPIEAVMLTRIRDVCSLVSIRDTHMHISIRCTPSWKNPSGVPLPGDDRWRRREISTFTSRTLLHLSYTARSPMLTKDEVIRWMHDVHASWTSCASDHTSEALTTTGFLVKYRNDGERDDENFVHIEGSLAEVGWNSGWDF